MNAAHRAILVATTNAGKRDELRALLGDLPCDLLIPADIGLGAFDVDETGDSFTANALLKAQAYAAQSGLPTLADDSGLVIAALNGEPGVYSARYAPTVAERNAKVLTALHDTPTEQRDAYFVCVIAVTLPGGLTLLGEGRLHGRIGASPRGSFGHGYDPIFDLTAESDPTTDSAAVAGQALAELDMTVKNRISHRARALNVVLPALRCLLF